MPDMVEQIARAMLKSLAQIKAENYAWENWFKSRQSHYVAGFLAGYDIGRDEALRLARTKLGEVK